jgi:nucleotide-binding universal stress UspA family protein
MHMKNILIAVESSDSAKKVALTGYDISRALKAQVSLLHVVHEPTSFSSLKFSPIMGYDNSSGLETVESDKLPELMEKSARFLNYLKEFLDDEAISTVVKTGEYWETILETAHELKAELIVVGTHNRKGIERLFSGSIAEKVLHHSAVPVLIVPLDQKSNESLKQ